LFAANQNSNTMTLFQIDQHSGRLIPTSQLLTVISPVCVQIVHIR
jgi:6-phosphogluconolactonase (cycloisomerase 2 family)